MVSLLDHADRWWDSSARFCLQSVSLRTVPLRLRPVRALSPDRGTLSRLADAAIMRPNRSYSVSWPYGSCSSASSASYPIGSFPSMTRSCISSAYVIIGMSRSGPKDDLSPRIALSDGSRDIPHLLPVRSSRVRCTLLVDRSHRSSHFHHPRRQSRRVWYYRRAPLIITLLLGFFFGDVVSEVLQGYLPVGRRPRWRLP
jgi:hypothetical protein